MKNILLSLIAIFITLGFSGCAPQFLNGVSPQGKDYNSAINRDSGNLKIMTTVEEDIKKRLPILVKAAALEFKKQGYEYFTLNPNLMFVSNNSICLLQSREADPLISAVYLC